MEDIREHFKNDMLELGSCFNDNCKRGHLCIPNDLFKKILDEYMENDYQEEEKFVLRHYIPKGELYDRNKAITYAEAQNVSIDDIVTNIGYGFTPMLPIYIFNKAVQKFGLIIWNIPEPWIIKRCDKTCPLGDYCNRQPAMIYTIADKQYCIGQLYMNRYWHSKSKLGLTDYTDHELCCMTIFDSSSTPERSAFSGISQFEMSFSYKEHQGTIYNYGKLPVPFYHRRINTYIGGNVIPRL